MRRSRSTARRQRILPLRFWVLLGLGAWACGVPHDTGSAKLTSAAEPEPEVARPSETNQWVGADRASPAMTRDLGALAGQIVIDGSSTVFPITEEVARRFRKLSPKTEIRLGVSGTGGGFKKFCQGQTMISDASRPIKDGEKRLCQRQGVEFIELPVAYDGLSVVVHPEVDWVECMTVAELRRLWQPAATGVIERWRQIRPEWPDEPIVLYAPGHDSGTFDYFTRAVVGSESSSRSDFIGSEDDYLLAQDIAGDRRGLGFFGYAYYHEYQDRLRLLGIDGGAGCVAPSAETILAGTYRPLSRPIFIYVSRTAAERPEVAAFVDFYLTHARDSVAAAKYVALPDRVYRLAHQRFTQRKVGSLFEGGSQIGLSIAALLELEAAENPS